MWKDLLWGAAAGTMATLPMTVLMEAGFRRLPWLQRYPLPPRQISMNVADTLDVRDDLTEDQATALTLAAHFGYGASCGSVYSAIVPHSARGVGTGVAFGLGVWAGSYLGLLPALGLLNSATLHPAKRTALMIAAHVVWGSAVGVLTQASLTTNSPRRRWRATLGASRERAQAGSLSDATQATSGSSEFPTPVRAESDLTHAGPEL